MKIVITALLLIACSLCRIAMYAQEPRHSVSAHLGITIPSNKGFIDKVGVVNPSLEWNYRVLPVLSAGVSLGYGLAIEEGEGNEHVDGDFVSGNREKRLSTVPLLATLKYFPFADRMALFSPYIGVGAGIQFAKYYITGDAINSNGTSNLAEVFATEVGTIIQPENSGNLYFDASCQWQYGGKGWSWVEAKSIQRLGFALGVGFKF